MPPRSKMTGKRFNGLTVLRYSHTSGESCRNAIWECICSCGKKAYVSSRDLSSGHVKSCGCLQHSKRPRKGATKDKDGYVLVYFKDKHPRTKGKPRIREHILIVEQVLGRHLKASECVHHVNGNKSDNRNSNLVICENQSYHMAIHRRMNAYKESGNPNYVKCKFCGIYSDPRGMYIRPGGLPQGWHRACRNDKNAKARKSEGKR